MSCSISKLKSHLLLTCKNFVFQFYVENIFCSKRQWAGGWGGWRGANPHYPFSLRPWLHMANHLSFSVRLITNHSNSILVLFIGWLFQALQILANQWLPNYLINMISSNIFSLCSFFSQHQPLDTHWSRSHYFGQISSSKLKFFKIVSL